MTLYGNNLVLIFVQIKTTVMTLYGNNHVLLIVLIIVQKNYSDDLVW